MAAGWPCCHMLCSQVCISAFRCHLQDSLFSSDSGFSNYRCILNWCGDAGTVRVAPWSRGPGRSGLALHGAPTVGVCVRQLG